MIEINKSYTVMIVDDTPANLKLMEDTLKSEGYRILSFPRGNLAIQAALRNPPDLILLDINMPEMNGFEVCRHLKGEEALKEIPVIFISAISETMDKVQAFAAGGVDYVTKPFQVEELKSRVSTHLRLRSYQILLKDHNKELEKLVDEKVREISESQMATIFALAKLAEHRDDDTGHHLERTRIYCRTMAETLKNIPPYEDEIDENFINNIYYSASLHDIGKVGIRDSILLKPAKLTAEEFEEIKKHPVIGARTLEDALGKYPNNMFISMGVLIAKYHHEKWDGSGYPEGLERDSIPLSARIMAIIDVYDALRTERVYKPPFSHEKSLKIIMEGSGMHFDPGIVKAFTEAEKRMEEISVELSDE